MKKLSFLFAVLLSIFSAKAQPTFQWVKAIGNSSFQIGYSNAVDNSGNVYTTGYFQGMVDFDPGPGTNILTTSGGGQDYDIYICKLDPNGNFIWAKSIGGGNSIDFAFSIAIDASDNVYTTGFFDYPGDFDPGPGTFSLSPQGGYGRTVFISKLDVNGNFVWAKGMGANLWDAEGYDITVDALGNVYTTGYFTGTADFDPGPGAYTIAAMGLPPDAFVTKLDASGNFVWARSFGGINDDEGKSVVVDASENVYVSGYFSGTSILKLNSNGNFIWTKAIGNSGGNSVTSMDIDSLKNIYCTGTFYGTVDFDPGAGIANLTSPVAGEYILKLDSSGAFKWAKSLDGRIAILPRSLKLDVKGNIYTTGSFEGDADLDPGPGTFDVTCANASYLNSYICKLDNAGNFIWGVSFVSNNDDNVAFSIAITNTGDIYTTGYIKSITDFDPSPGTQTVNTAGDADIFICKLNAPLTVGINEFSQPGLPELYPNPSHDFFKLNVGAGSLISKIEIYNIIGQMVFTLETGETSSTVFDLTPEPSGMYLLKTFYKNQTFSEQKIIKQ